MMTVLHVEDSDDDADQIELALDTANSDWRDHARLLRVPTLADARRVIATSQPHMILLDINLPGGSGHGFLAELKNDYGTRSIPVVVFTTSNALNDVKDAYFNFASAYLVKPDSFAGLVRMMRSLFAFWMHQATLPAEAVLP